MSSESAPPTESVQTDPQPVPQTPLKVEKLLFVAGKFIYVPMSIEEAISQSAKRIKILPSGKRISDTTYFQEKVKRLFNTEVKPKLKDKENGLGKGKNLLAEIMEAGQKSELRKEIFMTEKRKKTKFNEKSGKKVKGNET